GSKGCVQSAEDGRDASIIRRYLRRHLDRIRHCYERELLGSPGLAGTVVAEFQISPQGAVLSSQGQGMNDEVASCVAGVIQAIPSPRSASSTFVAVRDPFTFRPAGG